MSSARALRCSVKSGNERNPCCQLQVSGDTAPRDGEEGGDNVKSAWSFDGQGYTRATMGNTKGCQAVRRS
ncbi:MAG: hypothetical protein UU33_C0001G0252 [Candidatus Azambacteria bacterium GW2011_GWF1_41_10]|nr:MAG: hypothetical protein UU33_C0001G0252 [Candidatus Azambacteria bacterium GW2011_GWF1_41_10]